MTKKLLTLCFFFSLSYSVFGQFKFKGQVPPILYTEAQVNDSTYGIAMYDKLNPAIGGDSIRNDVKGYAAQGLIVDHYVDGKIIHKGYYVDGQLKFYTNYFDNGQTEREFKINTLKRCHMSIFYKNGKTKSDITYYNGEVEDEQDFYPNGQVSYVEQSDKSLEHILKRDSYLENGQPESTFELKDPDKKHKEYLYDKKEYYPNGKISKEGPMKYVPAVNDYQKDGTWKLYDDTGKLTETDDYVNGMLNDQKRE